MNIKTGAWILSLVALAALVTIVLAEGAPAVRWIAFGTATGRRVLCSVSGGVRLSFCGAALPTLPQPRKVPAQNTLSEHFGDAKRGGGFHLRPFRRVYKP